MREKNIQNIIMLHKRGKMIFGLVDFMNGHLKEYSFQYTRWVSDADTSWCLYLFWNSLCAYGTNEYFLYLYLNNFCICGTDGYLLARTSRMDILFSHLGVWRFNTRAFFFISVNKTEETSLNRWSLWNQNLLTSQCFKLGTAKITYRGAIDWLFLSDEVTSHQDQIGKQKVKDLKIFGLSLNYIWTSGMVSIL